jgi:hypothetical protein
MSKSTNEIIGELVAAIDAESKQRHIDDYRSSAAIVADIAQHLADASTVYLDGLTGAFSVFVSTSAADRVISAPLQSLLAEVAWSVDELSDNDLAAVGRSFAQVARIAQEAIGRIDAEISERKAAEDQEVSP